MLFAAGLGLRSATTRGGLFIPSHVLLITALVDTGPSFGITVAQKKKKKGKEKAKQTFGVNP